MQKTKTSFILTGGEGNLENAQKTILVYNQTPPPWRKLSVPTPTSENEDILIGFF